MKPFQKLTYETLQKRLDVVKAGGSLEWTRVRNFFYRLRNEYIRNTGDTTLGYTGSGNFYKSWTGNALNKWCKDNAHELGFSSLLWFRFREELKIAAKPKAVCEGIAKKFLLDRKTRDIVMKNCSLILLCEKDTVSEELIERLMDEGYKMNVVSTGGFSTGTVSEVIAQVKEYIDSIVTPNFYVLMLHDFDLSGLQILISLKKQYPGIIDVGVNSDFVSSLRLLPGFAMNLIEEDVTMSREMTEAKDYMQRSKDYTMVDYKYLQGKSAIITGKKGKLQTQWTGKRIEIDAIHAQHGIDPFVDYVLEKIENECTVWDLKRIGVDDFDLEEPYDYYTGALKGVYEEVADSYEEKYDEVRKPKNNIREIVDEVLGNLAGDDFKNLLSKYWGISRINRWNMDENGFITDDLDTLKEDYKRQMDEDWSEDSEYQDKLEIVNDKLEFYTGDVREGEQDLKEQVEKIQVQLEEDKSNDPYLPAFKDELADIDWGESELEGIETPDEKALVKDLIEKLKERLEELEIEDKD